MRISILGVATALMTLSGVAPAATITFNLNSTAQMLAPTGSGFGNAFTYEAGGLTVVVSAFGSTGTGGALQTAQLRRFSGGLGVCNQSEGVDCPDGPHATNNAGGTVDFILFSFSAAVDPLSITLGWDGGDMDASYWIGSQTSPAVGGATVSGLGSLGFGTEFVNNGSSIRTFNVDGGAGRSMLVSAQWGETNDAFKLKTLSVSTDIPRDTADVPEPATLVMMGAGLIGLGLLKKQRG
ncbi:MAG: PEP-CTERM sorting domain-containing protein [Bryobacterales bacterium]|nr:PEP-CTERM sorting domain-containing protein [Bryobacterales bacterium]